MPSHSFNQLKAELSSEQDYLSADGMSIAVAQLAEHIKKKNQEFKCLVIDRDSPTDELEYCLEDIKRLKADTRFQIVSKYRHHWSTLDVQINKGQISFFFLDAANTVPYILDTIVTINQICPEAHIKLCGSQMQKDPVNCAYFALDDAYNLAKIPNLHEALEPCVDGKQNIKYATYPEYIKGLVKTQGHEPIFAQLLRKYPEARILKVVEHIEYVSSRNFPQNFGGIIKNIQSLSMYSEFFAQKQYCRTNQKPIGQHIKKHTDYHSHRNHTLIDRKDKIQKSTRVYLEQHQHDYEVLCDTRQQFNKTISVNSLVDLLQKIDQLKKYAHRYLKKSSCYQNILDLAYDLTQRTQNLSADLRFNQNPVDLINFKNSFISLLHKQDALIKTHRKSWKVLLANILLALTGVGVIALACQSLAQQKFTLFFNKTGREKQVEIIERSLNKIENSIV